MMTNCFPNSYFFASGFNPAFCGPFGTNFNCGTGGSFPAFNPGMNWSTWNSPAAWNQNTPWNGWYSTPFMGSPTNYNGWSWYQNSPCCTPGDCTCAPNFTGSTFPAPYAWGAPGFNGFNTGYGSNGFNGFNTGYGYNGFTSYGGFPSYSNGTYNTWNSGNAFTTPYQYGMWNQGYGTCGFPQSWNSFNAPYAWSATNCGPYGFPSMNCTYPQQNYASPQTNFAPSFGFAYPAQPFGWNNGWNGGWNSGYSGQHHDVARSQNTAPNGTMNLKRDAA